MRIAVDARTIYDRPRRGTGKTLVDLYRRLAAYRPSWDIRLFHQLPVTGSDPLAGLGNVGRHQIDMPGHRWDTWLQLRLPLAARAARCDIVHAPANLAPRHGVVPHVVTIHDLVPLEMAPAAVETQRWLRHVRRGAHSARRVTTPSHYTRGVILRELALAPEKVIVNYWAADTTCARVTNPDTLAEISTRYGAAGYPFLLGFAASDPRKNTLRLLEAWATLPQPLRSRSRLLLVGAQRMALDDFRERTHLLGIFDTCLLHGFVPDDDVASLLSAARGLCYPSLSEGFGVPLLDAFACACPVLTSNGSSLSEVAGQAALLVDPTDTDAIAGAMVQLLTDDALRELLVGRGLERSLAFSWDCCAATLAGVLEQAVADL
jgi:glycosyltransferase involved in cell wall biosynthesis